MRKSAFQALSFAAYGRRLGVELIDTAIVSLILFLILFSKKPAGEGFYHFFVWWIPLWADPQRWQKFLIDALYTIPVWGFFSSSPGNKLMRLKIITENGNPINLQIAFLRYLAYWLSVLPLGLGFFWILWDPKRQAWHDKLAKTYVVETG